MTNLNEKLNEIFEILKSNQARERKVEFFLEELRRRAFMIKEAKEIILCGATPFAKHVFEHREYLFEEDIDIRIEDFDGKENSEKNSVGGGKIYVLCSRPNISKHLELLQQIADENIFSYQLLLMLEPRYSTNPYAYQYDKIIKQIEDIIDYANDYYQIYLNLADNKSKEIFMKVILFRLTYDPNMHYENATQYSHYFDADIVSLKSEEVFVDCGGYIGDTLEVFKKLTGNEFKKYYLFEPDKKLIEIAKTKGDQRVSYINKGVWNCEKILYFREETAGGNGSFVDECVNEDIIKVPVTNLDENINEATFIKMDIEGSELKALEGAKNVIRKCHPKLAICVYHKYKDFRELYQYIRFLGEYRVYLRAEMNNIDTELYYLCIWQEE